MSERTWTEWQEALIKQVMLAAKHGTHTPPLAAENRQLKRERDEALAKRQEWSNFARWGKRRFP